MIHFLSSFVFAFLSCPLEIPSPRCDQMTIFSLLSRPSCRPRTYSCSSNRDGHHIEMEQLPVPMVHVKVAELGGLVHSLLERNHGFTSLKSVFESLEGTLDTSTEPKVSLEHLLSCIKGVRIVSKGGIKYLQWTDDESLELEMSHLTLTVREGNEVRNGPRRASYSAMDDSTRMLINFGREVRGLLRGQPGCAIPFTKFIPAYHSHFGRQCCLQPYGFDRLVDLLEAVPNVVQVLGNHKVITLTHREQAKRFASDLIRVLKTRNDKRLMVSEMVQAFEEVFEKKINSSDYGVCYLEDVLADVWEGTIVRNRNGYGELVSVELPVRERSTEERYRTKLFVRDVIELFRTSPNFTMEFSKFIPRYHHYFRKQCRVADYGFSKLADLLASISPHTVEIIRRGKDADDDLIVLSERIRRRFVLERIHDIISGQRRPNPRRIYQTYQDRYGHDLSSVTNPAIRLGSLIRSSNVPSNYSRARNSYHNHNNNEQPVRRLFLHNHRHQFPEARYTKILKRPDSCSAIPAPVATTQDDDTFDETRSTTSTVTRKRRIAINFDSCPD